MAGYAFAHEGKIFTPEGRDDSIVDVEAHNAALEQAEIAYLAMTPDRFTAYVGKPTGERLGVSLNENRRELTTWRGTKIGTCSLGASWPVRSYIGTRMYQIYAWINGQCYTGRGFGEGMHVNLRKCK